MGYGSGSGIVWGLVKFAHFVVGSFIFGIIFWWTKAIVEGKKKKR